MKRIRIPDYLLLCIPLFVYLASYIYLAVYHGRINIFNTVVHEGGIYTLGRTILYASHFLGHVPMISVLVFFMAGSYICLTGSIKPSLNLRYLGMTAVFLAVSVLISLKLFGLQDTIDFIMLNKQSVIRYGEGGSWNLHIPSSVLLFLFIPAYIYILKYIFDKRIRITTKGLYYIISALVFFVIFTLFVNRSNIISIPEVFSDPRYLAHSVREIATFPVTYFPLVLYHWFTFEERGYQHGRGLIKWLLVLAVLFILGLIYQVWLSLSAGISDIAQKPDFAKNGRLSIPYLLASHYFEHFLDTIYFFLLSLSVVRRRGKAERYE